MKPVARQKSNTQFFSLKILGFACLLMSHNAFSQTIEPPVLENTAYVLIDYATGTVLAQKNADQPLPPASLTKMMTSYIIEKQLLSGQLKEDEPVKMSETAWCRGSNVESCMYVPVNSTASVLDMLKGIIIQSGNDAAKAMAEHISGSETAFANLMNQEAKNLGLTKTHFVNSTGMPAEGHVSSPNDLAKLAQIIIKDNNKYYPLYSEKRFTFNNITQANRNSLLFSDPTVDGLKTGHTKEAGFCLVASSKRGDMRLISVILGTKNAQERTKQSKALLDWGFTHYKTEVLAPANTLIHTAPVVFGKINQVELQTKDSLQVLMPKNAQNQIQTSMQLPKDIKAPLAQGQEVGTLIASIDGKVIATVPLVTKEAVEQSGFFSRMLQHIVYFFKNLF